MKSYISKEPARGRERICEYEYPLSSLQHGLPLFALLCQLWPTRQCSKIIQRLHIFIIFSK
jgi:hypothetical protein